MAKKEFSNPSAIKYSLTPEESDFVKHVLALNDEVEAYKRAYPEVVVKKEDAQIKNMVKDLHKKSPFLKVYIDHVRNSSPKDLARSVRETQLVLGTESQSTKAAENILESEEAANAKTSTERWLQIMNDAGAEIVIHPSATERVFNFSDLLEGRAHMRLPKEAKIRLCEIAGAPWNKEVADCQLSEIQRRFLEREERTLVLSAGSRMGKSALGACFALCELALPNRRIAIIGSEYQYALNEFEYLYPAFGKLFGWGCAVKHGYANQGNYYKGFIETLWGSSVHIFSLKDDNGASLLGKEYDLAIIGEAGRVDTEAIDRNLIRGLAGRGKVDARTGYTRKTGRMTLFSTPKGFEGIMSDTIERVHKLSNNKPETFQFPEGQVPWEESIYIEFASVLANPTYSKVEFEAQKKMLPKEDFAEQFEGRRVFRSGLVYSSFDKARHIVKFPRKEQIDEMRLGLGLDTGANTGLVFVGYDREGCLWQLGELSTKDTLIFDTLKDAEALAGDLGLDFNRFDLFQCDIMSQEKLALMNLTSHPWSFTKFEVRGTIDQMHALMAAGKFKITENCTNTIEQIGKYRWNNDSERSGRDLGVVKVNDHLLDALRYSGVAIIDLGPTFMAPRQLNYEQYLKKANEMLWEERQDEPDWNGYY